jgi:type IV fimbrial biogenesis protein FimT
MRKQNEKQDGFSLIELVAVMAIIAILLTVAVPSFTTMMKDNRLSTQTREIVSALNLARSEAIKRGARVTVCKSNDEQNCTAAGNDWSRGWIIYVDNSDPANDTRDAGDPILRVRGPLSGNNTLTGNVNVDDYISFVANGFSRLSSGGMQAGTLTLCDANDNNRARAIVISTTGRIQLNTVTCI